MSINYLDFIIMRNALDTIAEEIFTEKNPNFDFQGEIELEFILCSTEVVVWFYNNGNLQKAEEYNKVTVQEVWARYKNDEAYKT